jgi:hypothetical protein
MHEEKWLLLRNRRQTSMMLDNTRWPVPNGSEGLCYVETRVLTRVGATGIACFTVLRQPLKPGAPQGEVLSPSERTREGGSDLKTSIREARFGSRREWRRQVCPMSASPRSTRGLRLVERWVLTRREVAG